MACRSSRPVRVGGGHRPLPARRQDLLGPAPRRARLRRPRLLRLAGRAGRQLPADRLDRLAGPRDRARRRRRDRPPPPAAGAARGGVDRESRSSPPRSSSTSCSSVRSSSPSLIFDNSYPSGHTTVGMSVAVAAMLVVPRRLLLPTALGAGLFGSAFGVAVVAAGWHRPSDAVGAFLVVIAVAAACAALSHAFPDRAETEDRRGRRIPCRGSGSGRPSSACSPWRSAASGCSRSPRSATGGSHGRAPAPASCSRRSRSSSAGSRRRLTLARDDARPPRSRTA